MRGAFVLFVFLAAPTAGFLLGMQTSQDARQREFFELRGQALSEPEPQRPAGVVESAWVQLGPTCGIILSSQETPGRGDVIRVGQLTCRDGDEWHPVFLNTPPPSIVRSE